jgi:hypothetical protein
VLSTPGGGTAIHCGTLDGIDSRCIVSNNRDIGLSFPDGIGGPSFIADHGYGVVCDNASCARIDHNGIAGVDDIAAQVSVHGYGYGVVASASNVLISANTIVGMGSYTCNGAALGVSAGNGARVENNFIVGSRGYDPIPGPSCDGEQSATGLAAGGADVDSNYVVAWSTVTCGTLSFQGLTRTLAYGVQLFAAGGTFRNNVLYGCASVQEAAAGADPRSAPHRRTGERRHRHDRRGQHRGFRLLRERRRSPRPCAGLGLPRRRHSHGRARLRLRRRAP